MKKMDGRGRANVKKTVLKYEISTYLITQIRSDVKNSSAEKVQK